MVPLAEVALVITGAGGATLPSVRVLPVVVLVISEPPEEAATPLESCIADEVSVVEAEMVKARLAATPFDIVLELTFHITQVEAPAVLLHSIDEETPPPAATFNAVMSLVG